MMEPNYFIKKLYNIWMLIVLYNNTQIFMINKNFNNNMRFK
jgi:hypothetical protein